MPVSADIRLKARTGQGCTEAACGMKLYYTKHALLTRWLKTYPFDVTRPYKDVEHDALGGHIKTRHGYIWWTDWTGRRSAQLERELV